VFVFVPLFCYISNHESRGIAMQELPDILNGAIAQEFQETIQTGWLAAEYKHPGAPSDTIAPCDASCKAPDCDDSPLPADCTINDQTCPLGECTNNGRLCHDKKSAAFHPTLAGWSAPPALPLP
jgi:hypothetical protein